MQRAEELMQSIAAQIPGSHVQPTAGAPIVVVEAGDHPNGRHSIVWYNYPRESPLVLKVFSHHGDFAAPSRERRQYQVRSVEEVVSLINVLYRRTPLVLDGKERIHDILTRCYAQGESPMEEHLTELLADIIEYTESKDLVFEDIVHKADALFTDDEPQESSHV